MALICFILALGCARTTTLTRINHRLEREYTSCEDLGVAKVEGTIRPLPIADCVEILNQWRFAKFQYTRMNHALTRAEMKKVDAMGLNGLRLVKAEPDDWQAGISGKFLVPVFFVNDADTYGLNMAQAYIEVEGGPKVTYANVYALHCEFYHFFEWRLHPTVVRKVVDGQGARVWEIVGHGTKDDPMHYRCWEDTDPR